ncbi:MAG: S41 family peptidase [Anaerolineales bacterium]
MMPLKRLPLAVLLILSLACNLVSRALVPAVPTVLPSTNTPAPTALQPAYVPPDCDAASLATVPPATELALPTPAIGINPEIDHKTQLSVFDQTVNIVSKVYVYPDFNGKDWTSITAAERTRVEAGLSTEAFYSDMQTMVEALGDDHSHFDSPVDVAESDAELAGTGQYVGIGVSVVPEIDKGRVSIAGVFPGSPADHSGIKPHDSIIAVDGLPVIQDGKAYTYRVRGPECTAERLTVQSPNQSPRDIMLVRHKIEGDLPIDARLVPTTDGAHVGYILLPSFYDDKIPGEVADALRKFGTLDGLILDNRLNGGGSSSIVEPIMSYFVSGTLGEFKSRTASRPLAIQPDPIENSQTVPLVVLVGKDTASFGEIFSGVMQDSGRGKVVGETTSGNVEILHGYDFNDHSRLWVAEETFDPAVSHANWEATGIVPDVQAHADWDSFTFETDPAVAAALRLLGHR